MIQNILLLKLWHVIPVHRRRHFGIFHYFQKFTGDKCLKTTCVVLFSVLATFLIFYVKCVLIAIIARFVIILSEYSGCLCRLEEKQFSLNYHPKSWIDIKNYSQEMFKIIENFITYYFEINGGKLHHTTYQISQNYAEGVNKPFNFVYWYYK